MKVKKFKNGKINVKFEKDYDDKNENLLFHLLDSSELDFEIAIDSDGYEMIDYSVGNFDCATDLYNYNNGKIYTILNNDIMDFMNGKTVKLLAYTGKQTFKGILIDYERRNNSINGNPKYFGVFKNENGEVLRATTGTDSSCAYSFLNNKEKSRVIEYHETRTGNLIIDYITIQ